MKNYIIVILMSIGFTAYSQENDSKSNKWSIVASFGKNDWLLPGKSEFEITSLNPLHKVSFKPRFTLGIERTWHQGKKGRFYQDLKLSYCNETYLENQYGIQTTLGYEIKLFKGLKISPAVEIGYMLANRSDIVYAYNGTEWVDIKNPAPSVHRATFGLAPNLGYSISNKLDVFFTERFTLVTPFAGTDIPIFLFQESALGIRYKL